ncbi:MAG: NAD(P)-dependent dehydrogenase (short-subunit alcohol dehydrogenase family) [Bacillariaceae sp.]|jgi:NAD(P)-dependent dehydrogenase (short-subunit alcohol dehydrogenase family)
MNESKLDVNNTMIKIHALRISYINFYLFLYYHTTGTTSGTGFIAAETVAKHGGEVLLLNRSSSRSVESFEKLKALVPDGKFVPIECDLQDFASVRKAAKEIKETLGYKSIYCLSNNAGIMVR